MKQRTLEDIEQIYYKLKEREEKRGSLSFYFTRARYNAENSFCNEISDRIGLRKNYSNSFLCVKAEARVIELNVNNRYYTMYLSDTHYTNNNNMGYFIGMRGPVRTMFVRNNELIEY